MGLEGFANEARARGRCGDGMRWMSGDESAGEKLGAEEGEVVFDREDLGLCVKMVNG